jgi:predicted nucleic acid-binding protein
MRFWDSSALLGLVIQEKESHILDLLSESDPDISVWWGTRVEGASAVSRLEREGKLEAKEVEQSLQDLIDTIQAGSEIQPSEAIRTSAIRILRMHPLRAADALQLAAAFHASEGHPPSLEFVCLDARLALAAAKEGFRVLP